MTEKDLIQWLVDSITELTTLKNKPFRIAINGIEGTGKTTLAVKLVAILKQQRSNIFHISIDGFHFNKEKRYQQGRNSAKGYYEDSYDEKSFRDKVLIASQQSPPSITTATHDLISDNYLNLDPTLIPSDSIIITDGAYLLKDIYLPHWDMKIYLQTDFETALNRGAYRDATNLGGLDNAKTKFKMRYHKASQIYLAECTPIKKADIVINNSNLEVWKIIK